MLTISSCIKYLLNICDSYIQGGTNNGLVAAVNQRCHYILAQTSPNADQFLEFFDLDILH